MTPPRTLFRSRLAIVWSTVRDSLWFIPTIAAVLGVLLATWLVRVPPPAETGWLVDIWLFGGGAEGARGVLGTIAGSLITVTGVVFSVTIVALQLASTQFTPRVLRSFVADRANQAVLGIFIGTFTYTLLVLRTIRSATADGEVAVPQVAVSVAIALLLLSIGALIYYIDHAARSVQASTILHRETQQTLRTIARAFPDEAVERGSDTERSSGSPAPVAARESGYVVAVSADGLLELAARRGVVIRIERLLGDFVIAGTPLAAVWPAERCDADVIAGVNAAIVLGMGRTPEQDHEFGLLKIADIAVKALSPGINDPTTAALCIDRLAEIIAALARCPPRTAAVRDAAGGVRVIMPPPSFERSVGVAFDQIRHHGAGNPAIVEKLLETMVALAPLVGSPARAVLAGQVEALMVAVHESGTGPTVREHLDRRGRSALVVLREADL